MLPAIKHLTIYANHTDYQKGHGGALAQGLAAHGIGTTIMRNMGPCRDRFVACWSWHRGKTLHKMGKQVLVMERGYIGNRFEWTSLAWNGLNGRATRYCTAVDPARFEQHFAHLLKPWKTGGEFVLLIGQVQGDASLGGMDMRGWYERTAHAAAAAYGLPVRFRPHPESVKRGHQWQVRGAKTLQSTLAEALDRAAVVVTFNSNTAVESVLAGVPTVTQDMGSMARDVTGHKIGDMLTPDRTQWAARLAWCQFDMSEIKSGFAWECVRPVIADEVAA